MNLSVGRRLLGNTGERGAPHARIKMAVVATVGKHGGHACATGPDPQEPPMSSTPQVESEAEAILGPRHFHGSIDKKVCPH